MRHFDIQVGYQVRHALVRARRCDKFFDLKINRTHGPTRKMVEGRCLRSPAIYRFLFPSRRDFRQRQKQPRLSIETEKALRYPHQFSNMHPYRKSLSLYHHDNR